jgi:malate synthase
MGDEVVVAPAAVQGADEVLTPEAVAFVAGLQRQFGARRDELLAARRARYAETARTGRLEFLDETADVRAGQWSVAAAPPDLVDRRVEITGPTDPKMAINAMNSGAKVWLADLEDANTPHWANVVTGQYVLRHVTRRDLTYTSPEGQHYELRTDQPLAVPLVRPRGWHLDERHVQVDGRASVAALVDFGLFFFHNARELVARGSGPYFYLPKMESHLEARLWRDVFDAAESQLDVPHGTVRATVLIETIPAAFQMEEILYELRDHAAGLNAGRWDYLFSMIKCFREEPAFVLPDRNAVTMTVPFMHAYTEQLVAVCHRRGAHAMGGMSAVIPSRTDEEANQRAFDAVKADKRREAEAGYDGTWVAHPDSVPVAMAEFDRVLGDRPNQLDRQRDDVRVSNRDLLAVGQTPGAATEAGLRNDVNVGIQYISSWLRGNGAAGIYGLMEDAATAEIARGQVWQWLRHSVVLDSGLPVTRELVERIATEELARIRQEIGDDEWFETNGRPELSRRLFEQVALSEDFVEFLTLPAYDELLKIHDA